MSTIDLGEELADYGEPEDRRPPNPNGMGSHGRLADLQAQGFARTPQPGVPVPPMWGGPDPTDALAHLITWPSGPWLPSLGWPDAATGNVRCGQCQRYLPGVTANADITVFCVDCERMQRR